MEIRQITENKQRYMYLLLLSEPSESVINGYLETGKLFVLIENGIPQAAAVLQILNNGNCELKNISCFEQEKKWEYEKYLLHFLCEHYSYCCEIMYAGIPNTRKHIDFYESCGFENSHMLLNYYVDNFEEPIFADGERLYNKTYMKKKMDSEVDLKKVMNFALQAGCMLLQNGGEIFRVEETIFRICNRFHVKKVDTFTLSHAIMITIENDAGEIYTQVKNVPLSSANLEIVAAVNDLSREISSGYLGLDEAIKRLKEIENIPLKKEASLVLAFGVSSAAFGLILQAGITESMVAFVIGCVLGGWTVLARRIGITKILVNIISGMIMTWMAIGAMHLSSTPLNLHGMIIGAIMPLVPGFAFVNSIRDVANGDFLAGTVKMLDALLVFVYLAIGVGVTLGSYNYLMGGVLI